MLFPDEMLLQVEKPARYIGKEINYVVKNPADVSVRFALCFPDTYEIGMSHLGMQILYYFLNQRADTYCERVFSPWIDMERLMLENNYPLITLESYDEVRRFDFVGFTLQYEMSYTNILNMLHLAQIPIFSKDRNDDCPLVCAGGPCAYNPEPLADFIDFFYIGEGEAMLGEIMDMYDEHKKDGGQRREFLEKIMSVEGIYVPMFYDVTYKEDGTILSFAPNSEKAPKTVNKVIVKDLDSAFYPQKQLVPLIETVHDRVALEVFRGCIRGCRFCQAGFVYRPVREKTAETLLGQAKELIKASGHEEISLVSLSTSDYTEFKPLTEALLECFSKDSVNISLPSLRIDSFNLELMNKVQAVRKSSLTFAPEAGTQRMRNVINKNLTEEDILGGAALAFSGGWNRVKLYFMVGLPTETEDDLAAIAALGEKIVAEFYKMPKEQRLRPVSVVLSTSCFVPKPFTPFQWEAQDDIETFMDKQMLVKRSFRKRQIKYNYHNADLSVLEGVMARGDRRVGKAIFRAWQLGARFDGWSEHFKFVLWKQALEETGCSIEFYAGRKRSADEVLPWDFINIGVTKEFLLSERQKALEAETTADCRTECSACGAADFNGGVCFEK